MSFGNSSFWKWAAGSCVFTAAACGGDPTDPGMQMPGLMPAAGAGPANPPNAAPASPGGSGGAGNDAPAVTAAPLRATPHAARYALVGEEVVLDGSESTGAASHQWFFGNGTGTEAAPAATARVTYDMPGRYQVVLRVFDERGNQNSASVTVSVTYPAKEFGTHSSTLARVPGSGDVVVVSTDANQLIVLTRAAEVWSVARRIDTCAAPRTVTVWRGLFATACQSADRVGLYPVDGGQGSELSLARGSAPFGVATDGERLFVSEQGTGQLAVAAFNAAGAPVVESSVEAIGDARGVAALPDGRVAVTRFRAVRDRSEIALVTPSGSVAPQVVTLAFDSQVASDAGISGIPSYLSQFAVSPTGREAFLPSLMANYTQGAFLSGRALTFETTLRASLSRVDLLTSAEDFPHRFQFDERGFAEAMAFSSRGDLGYIVMPGNRSVVTLDLLTGVEAGVLQDSGFAPDGAVVAGDDEFLLVNAPLSRQVAVYDLVAGSPVPVAHVQLLEREPLEPAVLRGKQLFNDAADPRLAESGYIACANCHFDGDSDRNVWDFTDRGEGLRNTISMLGRRGATEGPIHWSANFDEIQDFEHDIRNAFGGKGLLDDATFNTGTRNTTLGDSKAGLSPDLDALAAYANSLVAEPKSPFRAADGSLSAAALRGKASFESAALGCTTCHSGPRMTDSRWLAPGQPLLHDVGTFGAGSGQRLRQPLTGLDTPTLHGLWASPPYLHDGSALTLRDVLVTRNAADRHGRTSTLAANQVDDLVAYLLSIDGTPD